MVKRLRHVWKGTKLLLLFAMLAVIGLGFWLHAKERSLTFMKPWITAAVNQPDAPYVISIGDVTVDWTNAAMLGKLRIRAVSFAKRDGNVFGQLPEVYATIDPIGFLPGRHLLHKVILREPHLALARDEGGQLEFGLEDAPARMEFAALVKFLAGDDTDTTFKMPSLPFHDFVIQNAVLTFKDTHIDSTIVSSPFNFQLKRRRDSYDALVTMPFTVDKKPAKIFAAFRSVAGTTDHKLQVQLHQFPMQLFCLYGTCPEGVRTEGLLDGTALANVAEDMTVHGFHINLSTPAATMTTPEYFSEPLKFTAASIALDGDWAKKQVRLTKATLPLEDTTITAAGTAIRKEDGWYVTGDGSCTQLDVKKIYKYWPLVMAPDSRKWVTAKLKSGYAAKGTLKLNLTPDDFTAETVSDKAVDAIADARDITFEYLPGFPMVEKMSGIAHFTGKTVKVEGTSGQLLTGTRITHAILWCPQLDHPSNPMETTIALTAPAADAATMLALKHFPFDDSFGLNPKTLKGTVDANMKLKFNAFSNKPNADPDEIHLEAVDYDITTTLHDVAQENVRGGYHVKAMNGVLKATNNGLGFDGSVQLGDAPANEVKLSQDTGKPLSVVVKGRETKAGNSGNDFTLVYRATGGVPNVTLRGKRLDASVSYGGVKGDSILKDFPAMTLDVNLGELVMAAATPFREVVGNLSCSASRCESASFTAKADNTDVSATIKGSGGVRQFSLKANDAGAVLRAMDISDRVTKGKLELHGPYDDSRSQPQLNARLLITDFTLKNSEILGRILSIGSLTGLANALTGSGISFDKFAANVTSRGGVFTVDKGIASSNALGITTGGTIDLNASALNLRGVVAPAYALNSFIGKIPVIGMLAGGEGEGLIAFNYSVTGTFDKPDVGVNPLSGLTPGFLRGIFGVFDSNPPRTGSGKQAPGDEDPGFENPLSNVHKR